MQNKQLGSFMGVMIVAMAMGIGSYGIYNSLGESGSDFLQGLVVVQDQPFIVQSDFCADGVQNNDEEGIDCGGMICEPCKVDTGIVFDELDISLQYDTEPLDDRDIESDIDLYEQPLYDEEYDSLQEKLNSLLEESAQEVEKMIDSKLLEAEEKADDIIENNIRELGDETDVLGDQVVDKIEQKADDILNSQVEKTDNQTNDVLDRNIEEISKDIEDIKESLEKNIQDQTNDNTLVEEETDRDIEEQVVTNPSVDIPNQGLVNYKYDCTSSGVWDAPYIDISDICNGGLPAYDPNELYSHTFNPSFFCSTTPYVNPDNETCSGNGVHSNTHYIYTCNDGNRLTLLQDVCPSDAILETSTGFPATISDGDSLCSTRVLSADDLPVCAAIPKDYYTYTCKDSGDWEISANTATSCIHNPISYDINTTYVVGAGFCDITNAVVPSPTQCVKPTVIPTVGIGYACTDAGWELTGSLCDPIDYVPTATYQSGVDIVCADRDAVVDAACVSTTITPIYNTYICQSNTRVKNGTCIDITYDLGSTYYDNAIVCAHSTAINDKNCLSKVGPTYVSYICLDTGWTQHTKNTCTGSTYDNDASYYVGAVVCSNPSTLVNNCQIAPGSGGCGSADQGTFTSVQAGLLPPSALCDGRYTPVPYPLDLGNGSVSRSCEYSGQANSLTTIIQSYVCEAKIVDPPIATCGSAHQKSFTSLSSSSSGLCVDGKVVLFDSLTHGWTRGCDADGDGKADQLGVCKATRKVVSTTTGGSTTSSGSTTGSSTTGATSSGSTTGSSTTGSSTTGSSTTGSSTTGSSTTGGGGGAGGNNYCGDAKVRYNLGEECDDGNAVNGDGCSSNCKLESNAGTTTPNTPVGDLESRLRSALVKLRLSCRYDDADYRNIRFKDTRRSSEGDPADILKTYCIVKGYDKYKNTTYSKDAAIGVGEFIKMISKIHALDADVQFDEYGIYDGEMPYRDVAPDKRYTPYIGYALKAGLLSDVGLQKSHFNLLKPATELPKSRAEKILKNADITKEYGSSWGGGEYLMRGHVSDIMVDAYTSVFADYRYMYGNNTDVYQALLEMIQNKSETQQRVYIQSLIDKRSVLDKELMGSSYNIHVDGVVEFLNKILTGE